MENNELVSVFIDNSNLPIEGKFAVGRTENAGFYHQNRKSFCVNGLNIDYGHLLSAILNGRKLSGDPTIAGYRIPDNDTLWNYVQGLGFGVSAHIEKRPSMALTIAGMNTIWAKAPGVFVIVAGSGDYEHIAKEVLKQKWKVEIWFWSSGTSNFLKKENKKLPRKVFFPLERYYKHFTHACTYRPKEQEKHFHPRNRYILEVSDNEKNASKILEKWTNANVMDCFIPLKSFGWWCWDDSSVFLYFDSRPHMEEAKRWMKAKYPDGLQLWERNNK